MKSPFKNINLRQRDLKLRNRFKIQAQKKSKLKSSFPKGKGMAKG